MVSSKLYQGQRQWVGSTEELSTPIETYLVKFTETVCCSRQKSLMIGHNAIYFSKYSRSQIYYYIVGLKSMLSNKVMASFSKMFHIQFSDVFKH